MITTATTYAEARQIARDLRRAFAGADWIVRIYKPLFAGDLYRICVEA